MGVLYSYNFEHMYATIKYAQGINKGVPSDIDFAHLSYRVACERNLQVLSYQKRQRCVPRRAAYGPWRCSLSIFFPTIYKSTKYPVPRILASSLSIFTQLHSLRVEIYFIPNNLHSEKKCHAVHKLYFQHLLKIPSSSGKERTQAAVE